MTVQPTTRKRPILLIAIGVIAGICVLCVIGSLAMDAMGLLPTSTPSPIPTNTTLLTNTITPIRTKTKTSTPTGTSAPTNTLTKTSTSTLTKTSTPEFTPTRNQTALGASCIPNNLSQTGKVVDVVDGDTIKVLLDQDGQTYTVRYIGMDTPESTSQVEFFGAEASVKNVQLVFGKTITMIKDVSETDRYGRLLRYILVDNIFVNYELVAQGYANTASYPPDIACIPTFLEAEQKASASKLGLWAAPPTIAALPTSSGPGAGGNAPCNCSGPDLDCKDFSSHASAQSCYNYCVSLGFGNIFRLDGNDNDGLACESLP